jgi:tRNA 2-thiouridine synthesizing protein A
MPGGDCVTRLTRLLGASASARAPAPRVPGPPAHPGLADPPPAPALVIDALGRKCPIPIIMLAQRIREVPVGQIVAVLADDPAAKSDIPAWCGIKSQEFVAATALASGWALLIRRCY